MNLKPKAFNVMLICLGKYFTLVNSDKVTIIVNNWGGLGVDGRTILEWTLKR